MDLFLNILMQLHSYQKDQWRGFTIQVLTLLLPGAEETLHEGGKTQNEQNIQNHKPLVTQSEHFKSI